MSSFGNFVQEFVVGLDAREQAPGGGAPLGGREARLLGQEYDVAGDALSVKKPRLGADGVEARPLGVAGGRMVAQGGLVRAPPRRENEEEIVLEEDHVLRAGRERLDGGAAGPWRREHPGIPPGVLEGGGDEGARHL